MRVERLANFVGDAHIFLDRMMQSRSVSYVEGVESIGIHGVLCARRMAIVIVELG
jgi:hypothetical protein